MAVERVILFDPNLPENEEKVNQLILKLQEVSGNDPALALGILEAVKEWITFLFEGKVTKVEPMRGGPA